MEETGSTQLLDDMNIASQESGDKNIQLTSIEETDGISTSQMSTENTETVPEVENGICGTSKVGTNDFDIDIDIDIAEPEPSDQPSSSGGGNGQGNNPYAYLDRDEFSSERFKIELGNMPNFFGYGELKKLINKKLQLNSHKIKVMTGGAKCTFVNFKSEEARTKAISVLHGYSWKKSTITATIAKPAADPLVKKRAGESQGPPSKRTKGEGDEPELSVSELVRNQTIPWWDKAYQDQIIIKTQEVKKYMANLTKRLYTVNDGFVKKPEGELICPVEDVKISPVTENYRNKCEFTIGKNPETNETTVGFRLSSYKDGNTFVGPVADLSHLPQQMRFAASVFEKYIRSTGIQPYDPETHEGVWKQLTVRTTLSGQIMMIAVLHGNNLSPEEFEDLKNKMKAHLVGVDEISITSFYLKQTEKHGHQRSNAAELIFGDSSITESLWDLKFRISPDSFFQVNTKAAEVMYETIGSLANVDENTSLVDVCCGTGTVGISLAKSAGEILGVEIVLDAIRDANTNAEKNELSNKCTFFAGKAENLMDVVINSAKFPKIVAVVDPPRNGLHTRVVQSIRKSEKIQSLVYAACDANSAMRNFVDLCRPTSKAFKGLPFVPTKLVPVDLFPNTPHMEYVFLFERLSVPPNSPNSGNDLAVEPIEPSI